MNNGYPNQDQRYNGQQYNNQHYNAPSHAQSGSHEPTHSAPVTYGFEGLVPLEQQQQQAYLANLNAPHTYHQQHPQQPPNFYPPQQYNPAPISHYQPQSFHGQHHPPPQQQHAQPPFQQPAQHTPYSPQYHSRQHGQQQQYLHSQQSSSSVVTNGQQRHQHQQHLPRTPQAHPSQQHASVVQASELQRNNYPYPSSLDGVADYVSKPVHVQQPNQQQQQQQQQPKGQPQQQKSPAKPKIKQVPKTQLSADTKVATQKASRQEPALDYRLLLLSLADQYISQARLSAHQVISNTDDSMAQQYYKLVATGLGCYETVLKTPSWLTSPRQEAMVRLRYASILHEETDNDRVVEETLAKGIALCERNRLVDLKYSMQHLLARVVFTTKPKAAFKALGSAIEEAKAGRHVAWIYAFHFLRATLWMRSSASDEMKHALTSLQAVSELAKSQRDAAICAAANISEALLHIRLKGPDWHEDLERALASARAQLMSLGGQALPQIAAQIHILDLASALELCQAKSAEQKRKAMVSFFDGNLQAHWSPDGTILLPIRGSAADTLTTNTCGIFSADENGKTQLRISWLDKLGSWALAYMLNGIVSMPKAANEQPDAEGLFKEALKYADNPLAGGGMPRSLEAASSQVSARKGLRCYILLNLTFHYCNRFDLAEAANTLNSLRELVSAPEVAPSPSIPLLLTYLDAMIKQANGQTAAALEAYQSPALTFKPSTSPMTTMQQHLSILSSLSIILIVRAPSHPSHHILRPLLDVIAPIFGSVKSTADAHEQQLNPQLAAAYSLVLAVAHEDRWTGGSAHDNETSVLSTKKHLQTCFHIAKDMYNHLLLAAGLSFLHTQLFHGQVGKQALKSAQSAQEMARSAGSPLWGCASDGIAAQAYETSGLSSEAQRAREHGAGMAARLPAGVVEALALDL